jgi:dipeptidyl aminopeptidase/acylaminoacyl peptidase
MPRLRYCVVLSFACFPFLSAAAGGRSAYTPEQLSLIRFTEECRICPDGKTIAFTSTITGAVELWTVPAVGGWPNQLTNLHEHVTDIGWSPDGKWIVFASDYDGNERHDLYRVPAAGGQVEQLTQTKLSESEPAFSPDGKRLAFTADPQQEFLFQLHVMDLKTRKVTQLTREKIKVQNLRWSPDGKTIAITRTGDEQKGQLLLVDAASGATRVVEPAEKDGILLAERFSPNGKSLLLTARNKAGFLQLAVLDLKETETEKPPRPAGPPTLIGPGDWDVQGARWNKDGIYFLRNEGGATGLYFLASPQARLQQLLPPAGSISQFSLDDSGEHLAMLKGDVARPDDVWVLHHPRKLASGEKGNRLRPDLKQVTFSLMGGVRSRQLSQGQLVAYKSFDGKTIHTLVLKPRAPRLGSPPPAIVFVHGGPNGQVSLSFRTSYHVLSEAGFVVIAPNYRGSTGYGKAFEDANNKDWGGGDLKDLTSAVKYFAGRGDIDPRRVGIMGGSYGGYMTLMALSRTPSVWKAGVELYGMPDLVMDYLLSKNRFADWYETEMGNPRTNAALYRARSPLPYLDDIKAPLLVFQGAADSNVPRAESDLLVAVLKELKKKHEYIVYPDEGHGFYKRKNLLDYYKRTTAFFVKELGPKKQ